MCASCITKVSISLSTYLHLPGMQVLVLSYMLSVGAVVGAVALLLHMDSQARDKDTARGLWVGAVSPLSRSQQAALHSHMLSVHQSV